MSQQTTFSLQEVSELLHVAPQRLRQWEESFPLAFGDDTAQAKTRYSQTDLATLLVIQRFLENGFSAEQILQHLNGHSPAPNVGSSTPAQPSTVDTTLPGATPAAQVQTSSQPTNNTTSPAAQPHTPPAAQFATANLSDDSSDSNKIDGNNPDDNNTNGVNSHAESTVNAVLSNVASSVDGAEPDAPASYLPEPYAATAAVQPLGDMVGEMLGTVANSQQSMLNIQDSIREMLGVIVQDNFNLKTENRKLRDRMLELERALAEYQRREETRKERLEGRLRAVEGTLSAMQQQLAQLVQLQRQKAKRNRFW